MKKQASDKTNSVRANKNDRGSYLSLSRQTYKPYVDGEDESVETQDDDADRIVKFAY